MNTDEEHELKTKLGNAYREINRLKAEMEQLKSTHSIRIVALRKEFLTALSKQRSDAPRHPLAD